MSGKDLAEATEDATGVVIIDCSHGTPIGNAACAEFSIQPNIAYALCETW